MSAKQSAGAISAAPKPAEANNAPRRAISQNIAAAGIAIASSNTAHGQPSATNAPGMRHGKSSAIAAPTPSATSAKPSQNGSAIRLPGMIRLTKCRAKNTLPLARIAAIPPTCAAVIM